MIFLFKIKDIYIYIISLPFNIVTKHHKIDLENKTITQKVGVSEYNFRVVVLYKRWMF